MKNKNIYTKVGIFFLVFPLFLAIYFFYSMDKSTSQNFDQAYGIGQVIVFVIGTIVSFGISLLLLVIGEIANKGTKIDPSTGTTIDKSNNLSAKLIPLFVGIIVIYVSYLALPIPKYFYFFPIIGLILVISSVYKFLFQRTR